MSRIKGVHALVTGGTRGIGLSISRALQKHGAQVAICGTTAKGVDGAVASMRREPGHEPIGIVCDVRRHAQVREMLQKLSHKLAQGIGVSSRVKLVEPSSIRRDQETSPLVIDLRK